MRKSRHRFDMYALVVCLTVFVRVSESRLSINMYQPLAPILPSKHPCEICSEVVDCVRLDEAKCTYYEEASQLVYEELPPPRVDEQLNEQVNGMLFDYIEEVLTDENTYDCIPFLSKFTDCDRDNICLGCNSCICDGTGQWNCSVVQRCTPTPTSDINHLTLTAVIQNIKENDEVPSERKKRDTNEGNSTKITHEEIYNWWYNPPTLDSNENKIDENKQGSNNTESKTITPIHKIKYITSEDSDNNLAFAEVLNNIFTEDKTEAGIEFSKMKNKKQLKKFIDFESNITFNNIYEMLIPFDNNQTTQGLTERKSLNTENNTTSKYFVKDLLHISKNILNGAADEDILDYITKTKNIVKRSETYTTTNKYASHANFPNELFLIRNHDLDVQNKRNGIVEGNDTLEDFQENIVSPLSDVIHTKQVELEQLMNIRENLNKFMRRYSGGNYSMDIVPNITSDYNSSITFHTIETEAGNEKSRDFRRSHVNVLEKYNTKLRHDIYVILKDIAAIHKLSKRGVPENIRFLVRALRYFIRHAKLDNNEKKRLGTFRRNMNWDSKSNKKELIVKILELIDNDMPEVNALGPLSDGTKKVLKRVIENNNVEHVIKIRENYDLDENLRYIGSDWKSLTDKVTHSSPRDQLYRLKLLYLNLSADIEKIVKGLFVINFIKARRMSVDEKKSSNIINSIKDNLNTINGKIQMYFLNNKNENTSATQNSTEKRNKKKSFLKQIKSLLKLSKNKVIDLMNKKVPKKDIIKEVAKTKLNEITRRKLGEYEKKITDWQNYFNVTVRSKRSIREFKMMKNPLKNILPKYLRGKLNPAISKRRNNKNQTRNKFSNKFKN